MFRAEFPIYDKNRRRHGLVCRGDVRVPPIHDSGGQSAARRTVAEQQFERAIKTTGKTFDLPSIPDPGAA